MPCSPPSVRMTVGLPCSAEQEAGALSPPGAKSIAYAHASTVRARAPVLL